MKSKRKRRYRSPDGVDWRDPEMPVTKENKLIASSRQQMYSIIVMECGSDKNWRKDASYHWSKSKGIK